MESNTLSAKIIKQAAERLGFTACGMAPAERVAPWQEARVREWLDEGKNGEMAYLENNVEMRLDPRLLVPEAKTVVSLALNYYQSEEMAEEGYHFARYAYGKDYHDVMRRKLRELMQQLGLKEYEDARPFCDTAPVDERYWAWRCGLGWIGRNTQLIVPRKHGNKLQPAGSYFFLGELITTREVDQYDSPIASRCGNCRACLDACPTKALTEGGLDARRCLSYLTIEYRGELSDEIGDFLKDCIYGCDRCSEACPWNNLALPNTETDLQPSEEFLSMTQDDWNNLTIEQYRKIFKGSAVKRAKYEGLTRNIRLAAKKRKEL